MKYRCVATSVDGFVQQVAVAYLTRGYWFYVTGHVPDGKDPAAVDAKLVAKYRIDVSQKERCRRKRAGLANMQYIRHERFFLLMATHGQHPFFEEEANNMRDARRIAIRYAGYSLSFRNKRASVRIAPDEYERIRAHLLELASRRSSERLVDEFKRIQLQPFAPVRTQLLCIWRAVNQLRRAADLDPVTVEAVPWRRAIIRPFAHPRSHDCGQQEPS